ncbi:MAG: fibronectin type III domain-containing protein, partial [Bacteroidales bacterium]|nr:fibronectin type III domain-containing protein [Bacteroidales bacterium]
MRRVFYLLILFQFSLAQYGQIIADHSVVDLYADIPQQWIDSVKTMWLSYAGESHSGAVRGGLWTLGNMDATYAVSIVDEGIPEAYTDQHLRASRATWGDINNDSGWIYNYGENDWFTSELAITRTKAGITYCNTNNLTISAFGFGWCWDTWIATSDQFQDYLDATQQYIDYCHDSINTQVFFTTGTVDTYFGETGYLKHLGYEQIRNYVRSDPARVLFDYADILCYDNGSETPNTTTWEEYTYPVITTANVEPATTGHISPVGALRLAKAMWWMLARIAGWDGNIGGEDTTPPSVPSGLTLNSASETSINISWNASTDNVGVTGYRVYRNGSLLGSTSSSTLTYTDNIVSGYNTYTYSVSAQDAAGNESAQSTGLAVSNCPPDLTPTLIVTPNISHGVTTFDVIVRITELNIINTGGTITVNIPKDTKWDLDGSFSQSLTVLSGFPLNNDAWTYASDATNHIFTTSASIPAGSY